MNSKTVLQAAQNIHQDILDHRRHLHRCAEVGSHLPKTATYVKEHLIRLGYSPVEICDSGIVATITGTDTGRCILLRADMDALPIEEKADVLFPSQSGAMHACGHDMHTAMLLGTAALLQKFRQELQGTVKLVFQPDEEGLTGANAMIAAGVLKDPAPQAGFALHVHSGTPSGQILCGMGTFMAGCTPFRITVTGTACHGATPETGVDPINIAAHIYLALQTILTRETSPKCPVSITFGKFSAGHNHNVIPPQAVLEGTLRSFDRTLSQQLLSRVDSIAKGVAQSLLGNAVTEQLPSTPPLVNHPELTAQMASYAEELVGKSSVISLGEGGMGSEDFALYTHVFPCSYLLLGAGSRDEEPLLGLPMHNECVVFNEDILPLGTALETWCAMQWLNSRTK